MSEPTTQSHLQAVNPSQSSLRHNLKNQLTGLKALLELLKRNSSLDPQGKDYLLRMDSKLDGLHQTLEQFFQTVEVNK